MDGSGNFERNWKSYKEGFGNVHSEYWLGKDIKTFYSLLIKFDQVIVLFHPVFLMPVGPLYLLIVVNGDFKRRTQSCE